MSKRRACLADTKQKLFISPRHLTRNNSGNTISAADTRVASFKITIVYYIIFFCATRVVGARVNARGLQE